MTLLDDTFDCCGRRFDPMGDPWLIRGEGYAVYCHGCRGKYPDNCRCGECVEKALLAAKAEAWDEGASFVASSPTGLDRKTWANPYRGGQRCPPPPPTSPAASATCAGRPTPPSRAGAAVAPDRSQASRSSTQ